MSSENESNFDSEIKVATNEKVIEIKKPIFKIERRERIN